MYVLSSNLYHLQNIQSLRRLQEHFTWFQVETVLETLGDYQGNLQSYYIHYQIKCITGDVQRNLPSFSTRNTFLLSVSFTLHTHTHSHALFICAYQPNTALLHAPSEKFIMLFRFIYKLFVLSKYIPTLETISFQLSLLTMH